MSSTVQHRLTLSLSLALACGALASCTPTLPPPTVSSSGPIAGLTARSVCPEPRGLRHFSLDTEQPLTAVLECSHNTATFVVFNQYQVRVRTISLTSDGHIRDEISYLCPDSTTAEEIITAIKESLGSPAATAGTGAIQLAISGR